MKEYFDFTSYCNKKYADYSSSPDLEDVDNTI